MQPDLVRRRNGFIQNCLEVVSLFKFRQVSESLALSMNECLSEIFPIDFSLVEACCFESEVDRPEDYILSFIDQAVGAVVELVCSGDILVNIRAVSIVITHHGQPGGPICPELA